MLVLNLLVWTATILIKEKRFHGMVLFYFRKISLRERVFVILLLDSSTIQLLCYTDLITMNEFLINVFF